MQHVPPRTGSPSERDQGLAAIALVRPRALRRHSASTSAPGASTAPRESACGLDSAAIGPFAPARNSGTGADSSWKQQRSNPLPQQIALGLGRPTVALLHRTRAGLSQHHLNKTQRQANLIGAFQAIPLDKQEVLGSVWLVDDILTTGSTALAAREALEAAGHRVAGLICLARTPARERRR